MKNQNPYIHDGKVPLRTEMGGREMTLLYNGIKMISSFEVGDLTLDIIYADSKVVITDISDNEKRTINEYPIEKFKEAKKEFHKLTQRRLKNKKAKIKAIDLKELWPNTNVKNNFMLVVQLNESLIIYDLRGKEPREAMRFPNNQYKKARIELLKLEEESKKELKQNHGVKPYKKTRYILKVMPPKAIVLMDLGQKPPKELKRFPPDQIEQAKKEMVRLEQDNK